MIGHRIPQDLAAFLLHARRPTGAGVWRRRWLAATALACLAPAAANALEPVPVAPGQPVVPLADAIELLEDPAGELRIEDVTAPATAGRFRPNPSGRDPSFGSTRSAWWFRFSLANESRETVDLLLQLRYPLLDRIEFHAPGQSVLVLGDTLPFHQRPLPVRHFVMPLTVPAGATETFHLRVETAGILTVPLELGSAEQILDISSQRQLGLGILYGIFLGATLYNLFLWLSVRDSANLYLVGHVFSIGFAMASIDGLAFQIWPTWTGWQQWASHLFLVLVASSTLLFVRSLVAGPAQSPRLDRALRWALGGLLLSSALAVPFGPRILLRAAMAWLILIGILLTVTVLWHARRGHLPAKIYALAWGVFLAVMAFVTASGFGLFPHFFDLLIVGRIAAAVEVLLAASAVATKLREARRALAASETKFSRAFRSSPDALSLTTLDEGRFIEVNDAFEEISGHTRAEALDRTYRELGLWTPEERGQVIDEVLKQGAVRQREIELIHKSGRKVPVQLSAELMELDGRQVLLATARDISQRKAATAQRERLIRELEAKNTELERFTYTASHDLRSPLVTISGFLGVLEKDYRKGDRDRFRLDLGRIRDAAEHMRQLLDELLDLSRVGRVLQPLQVVPLIDVAQEAVEMFRREVEAQGIDLRVASDLPVVRGDRTRLLQVFQNLLDNAIRFLGSEPAPRIEIGCRRDGESEVCFIRDNGIGIEPEHHRTIFELFRRLQPGVDGTGVGLALVRRIVESHGGRIWVESDGAGTGSTFCFELPKGAP